MRLIDADAVVKMLEVFIANTDDCAAYKDYNFAYRRCKRLIQDEPTAYDIDNVVEELEEVKQNALSTGLYDDMWFSNGIQNAIDIVKGRCK